MHIHLLSFRSSFGRKCYVSKFIFLKKVFFKKFVVRNDMACGSTVGPILSAKLGLKTVDVGAPQLAMHSIREMSCISGVYYSKQLFSKFFDKYADVSKLFQDAA
uniref:aspartyl aminopeptidase n=1 Tax=Romanomermis culicivorax TaxID=13658 RepID=A0A915I6S4_ROMCU